LRSDLIIDGSPTKTVKRTKTHHYTYDDGVRRNRRLSAERFLGLIAAREPAVA
jgi:hypothetical protein